MTRLLVPIAAMLIALPAAAERSRDADYIEIDANTRLKIDRTLGDESASTGATRAPGASGKTGKAKDGKEAEDKKSRRPEQAAPREEPK